MRKLQIRESSLTFGPKFCLTSGAQYLNELIMPGDLVPQLQGRTCSAVRGQSQAGQVGVLTGK